MIPNWLVGSEKANCAIGELILIGRPWHSIEAIISRAGRVKSIRLVISVEIVTPDRTICATYLSL